MTQAARKRERKYLQWVASLPCAHCHIEGQSQAAHYQGMRADAFGRGLGIKTHDLLTAPLCIPSGNNCHIRFDNYEFSTLKDRWGRKIDSSELFEYWILKTLLQAQKEGVLYLKA